MKDDDGGNILDFPGRKANRNKAILDSQTDYVDLNLLNFLEPEHIASRMAKQISLECDIPESTVFMVGLGVFSTISCRAYAINYEHGGILPTSLYVAAEQPSGIGKTRCLSKYQRPFYKIVDEIRKELQEKIDDLLDDDIEISKADKLAAAKLKKEINVIQSGLFLNNVTPEGMETSLVENNGYFSIVAAEKGALNTLLGMTYGDQHKKPNNDLILHGFDGGYYNGKRAGREAYFGFVVGGVACFAQSGTAKTVINASDGSGVSERFIFTVENHQLGKRTFEFEDYDVSIDHDYQKICYSFKKHLSENARFDKLPRLSLSWKSWREITKYRKMIEPNLQDGCKFSYGGLRGAAAKIDMQIMKIAANLHLLDSSMIIDPVIKDKYVTFAIHIANALLKGYENLNISLGIQGDKAAIESILSLFEKDNKPRIERGIIQCKAQTAPFKNFTGNKSEEIRRILDLMVSTGILKISFQGESDFYSLK